MILLNLELQHTWVQNPNRMVNFLLFSVSNHQFCFRGQKYPARNYFMGFPGIPEKYILKLSLSLQIHHCTQLWYNILHWAKLHMNWTRQAQFCRPQTRSWFFDLGERCCVNLFSRHTVQIVWLILYDSNSMSYLQNQRALAWIDNWRRLADYKW